MLRWAQPCLASGVDCGAFFGSRDIPVPSQRHSTSCHRRLLIHAFIHDMNLNPAGEVIIERGDEVFR
jgi:hypothetical protein